MTTSNVQIIVCYVIVFSSLTRSTKNNEKDLLAVESRHQQTDFYPEEYGIREFRRKGHIPITFRAPDVESVDYWRLQEKMDSDRRTFIDNLGPNYYERKNFPGYNTFNHIMNQLLGTPIHQTKPQPYPKFQDDYAFKQPYKYHTTEPTILPPPKPLRASIIKLETTTQSSDLNLALDYKTTSKYYPHFVNLLNQILLENTKLHNENDLLQKPLSDPTKRLQSKPEINKLNFDSIIATTYKPITNYLPKTRNFTSNKYPGSIQDKLPPLKKGEDSRIPYVSPTTTLYPLSFEKVPKVKGNIIVPTTDFPEVTNTYPNIDIRLLKGQLKIEPTIIQQTETPEGALENLTNDWISARNNDSNDGMLTGDSTETYRIIKITPRKSQSSKQIWEPLKNSSVEMITDLTVKGWLKNMGQNVNIPRYKTTLNMSNLISYEMDKLRQNSIEPRSDREKTTDLPLLQMTSMPKHLIDINDELSLDVKILRDTNWDGFTTSDLPTSQPTTMFEYDITTEKEDGTSTTDSHKVVVETRVTKSVSKVVGSIDEGSRFKNLKMKENKLADPFEKGKFPITERRFSYRNMNGFNTTPKDVDGRTLGKNISDHGVWAKRPVISEQKYFSSTSEIPFTTESTVTNNDEPITTTIITIPFSRTNDSNDEDRVKITSSITKPMLSHSKRKYQRLPKVTNFTPYPKVLEKQEKEPFLRNNFLKKSNSTTNTLSNRSITVNENHKKNEIMKFSDDDATHSKKGRKTQYKKRRYPGYQRRANGLISSSQN